MPNNTQNFWNFSLELYDREGVATACLELQEECQLDVNLLLFCYWHGSNFGVFDTELLRQVIAFSLEWRLNVVQRLRDTRNWMKLNANESELFQTLRKGIKTEELAAEKYQQEQLARMSSTFSGKGPQKSQREDIEDNINMLLQALGITPSERIETRLEAIHCALETQTITNR